MTDYSFLFTTSHMSVREYLETEPYQYHAQSLSVDKRLASGSMAQMYKCKPVK